jgi:hypothetical protein
MGDTQRQEKGDLVGCCVDCTNNGSDPIGVLSTGIPNLTPMNGLLQSTTMVNLSLVVITFCSHIMVELRLAQHQPMIVGILRRCAVLYHPDMAVMKK